MHKAAQEDWSAKVFKNKMIWERKETFYDKWQEGTNQRPEAVELDVLVHHNYFRSWPINDVVPSGEIDKQSMLVYISMKQLSDKGLLSAEGFFEFNSAVDKFIVDGVRYKSMGDDSTAQNIDESLYCFIIMQRDQKATTEPGY